MGVKIHKKKPERKQPNEKELGYPIKRDWRALKHEFIDRNLDGEVMTLQDFASEKGLRLGTLRNHSAQENWIPELEEKLDRKNTNELVEVKEAHKRAITRLRAMAINEEVSVRARHASFGRKLQTQAYSKFNSLTEKDIGKMHIRDVLAMMRLGIDMEKNALGLLDRIAQGHPLTNPQEEMARQTGIIQVDQVDHILADVLDTLWRGDVVETTHHVIEAESETVS